MSGGMKLDSQNRLSSKSPQEALNEQPVFQFMLSYVGSSYIAKHGSY